MMIRPYKPRDSARSALLTAVRNRRSGPCRAPPKGTIRPCGPSPLTGAAKYAWGARGLNEDVDAKIEEEFRVGVAHVKVRRVADR
jgi:hypothetical protein